MRKLATLLFICFSINSFGQIGLGFYDLPYWGDTYYRNVVPMISSGQIPENVFDSTEAEMYWDLSGFGSESELDTVQYYWVEGTSAAFDFPDANMVDYDPENDNGQYQYYIKNETGFYFSGQSGGLSTEQGTFDIKAEFRPAVPIIKVPARYGDVVEETSRSSVDLLTIGNVKLTTKTKYVINGYGTIKIPTGEEQEVLRVKRITESEVIFSIQIGPNTLEDTTINTETSWEFFASGYGDPIASINKTFDENIGLDQYSLFYKDERIKSGISGRPAVQNMSLIYLANHNKLIVKDEDLKNGGTIEIYGLNGQLIYENRNANTIDEIGTETFVTGAYVIKTKNNQGAIETKKIIIN